MTRDEALMKIAEAASAYVDEHYRLGVNTPLPELFMKLSEALKAYDAASARESWANEPSALTDLYKDGAVYPRTTE